MAKRDVEPIRRVSRQLSQSLQDFRKRLSERALSALGVPLRTNEIELHVQEPGSPDDVRVGKIFDRSWELLSFILPMWAIGGFLKRHFRRKVADVVFMNLSRLAGQWEQVVNESISALEKEAIRRLGWSGRDDREADRLSRTRDATASRGFVTARRAKGRGEMYELVMLPRAGIALSSLAASDQCSEDFPLIEDELIAITEILGLEQLLNPKLFYRFCTRTLLLVLLTTSATF
jgi:hypothetical protein